jgi:Flp pilus assembly protein TadG
MRVRDRLRRTCCELGGLRAQASGQSSVEYALVLVALLAMVLALGAVWAAAHDGGLMRLGERAASHAVSGSGALGGIRDIVLF